MEINIYGMYNRKAFFIFSAILRKKESRHKGCDEMEIEEHTEIFLIKRVKIAQFLNFRREKIKSFDNRERGDLHHTKNHRTFSAVR
jgi:hypothetical protein